jgi:hypothetical protein
MLICASTEGSPSAQYGSWRSQPPVATGAMMSTALAWEMKCGGRAVMNEQSEDDSLERAPDD